MPRRFTLLICLLAALATPIAAHAQTPFSPLPPAVTQPQQQQQQTTTAANTDNGGLDAWQQILLVAGGGILLLGIAWAIVSDARSAAPVEDPTEELEAARLRKETDYRRRKERNRAATKRQRAARKRNR